MSTHESFARDESIEGSTDRGFGLTVGGILLAIALLRVGLGWWHSGEVVVGWFEWALGVGGASLLLVGLVAPATLAPLNKVWTKLGLLLFKVLNPIVLAAIFLVTIVPIGLLLRVLGKDPLRLKFDPDAASYWIARDPPGPAPESMPQQF
ncbi:MAG: SxtJ family membrane protein [Alphaproteobacteria bacterium]